MAEQTNIYWGSHDFDRTRPLGQRFVVALSNPPRNLPLDSLEQLGQLPLYHWQGGKKVRRTEEEVAQYAAREFGGDVIIAPSSNQKRDLARFNFYRKPAE